MRDELGIVQGNRARPLQAAGASFASFRWALRCRSVFGLAPQQGLIAWIALASLGFLALLGACRAGGRRKCSSAHCASRSGERFAMRNDGVGALTNV